MSNANIENTYRMYGFVPFHLSGIQKGIQFSHAINEYEIEYGNTPEYRLWSRIDKTMILLNGGISNDNTIYSPEEFYNLPDIFENLSSRAINVAFFREPDLSNIMTCVCFLADNRVWDWENYPTFYDYCGQPHYEKDSLIEKYPNAYNNWVDLVGGKNNVFRKELIYKRGLAS